MVKLEQNYRSTQTILAAANAVDRPQPRAARRSSSGPTPSGGEPVAARRARRRARGGALGRRRDRAARRGGGDRAATTSRSSTGPTRRAGCSRTRWSASSVPYQVIGGTKFYERAEIKDAVAYLSLLVNPADPVSFARIVNSPRRGIGNTSQGAARLAREHDRPADLGGRRAGRGGARARRRRDQGGRAASTRRWRACASAADDGAPVAELLEAVLQRDRLPGGARGRAHDRGRGPGREPRGAGRRRRRVRRQPRARGRERGAAAGGVPRSRSRSTPSRTRSRRARRWSR